MLLPILTGEKNPILRKPTERVPKVTKEIKKLLKDMRETTVNADGAGLAAPQIGVSLRICISNIGGKLIPLINPDITFMSKEQVTDEEGCLSLPGLNVIVPRSTEIIVKFLDEDGKPQERRLSDFDARVIQHEVDHLEGKLIVDYAAGTAEVRRL